MLFREWNDLLSDNRRLNIVDFAGGGGSVELRSLNWNSRCGLVPPTQECLIHECSLMMHSLATGSPALGDRFAPFIKAKLFIREDQPQPLFH